MAPTASTSRLMDNEDFPLDPALSGAPSSNRGWRTGSVSSGADDESLAGSDDDDGDDDDDEGEEDYEDGDDGSESEDQRSRPRQPAAAGSSAAAKPSASTKGKGKQRQDEDMDMEDDTLNETQDGEDFDRLVTAIRSSDTTIGGRSALNRAFDRTVEEELDGIDDPLNNGIKRKGGPGRRSRAQAEPSREVQALIGQANQHYAVGEQEQAIEVLQEIVRIDPNLRVPWFTLASIYDELGDIEKAISFRIIATHLEPLKKSSANWASLGAASRDIGQLHQAIYCYSRAIKGNPEDRDSMWARAVLLKLSGSFQMASKAFTALLRKEPHDPGILREYTPMLVEMGFYFRASDLYLAALDHFRSICPHVDDDTIDEICGFDSVDLEFLADCLLKQQEHAKVVQVIKSAVRWLQGREKQTGWDTLDDDREYDLVRKTREGWQRDARHLEEASVYELDVTLRTRLGLARMGQGRFDEADRHFRIILQEPVEDFTELYGTIADSYIEHGMLDDALDVLQTLAEKEETNGPHVWMKVARCHLDLGNPDDSRECYEAVLDEDPEHLGAMFGLAKCLELHGQPHEALILLSKVIAARKERGETIDDRGEPIPILRGRPRGSGRRPDGRGGFHKLTREERQSRAARRAEDERVRDHQFAAYLHSLDDLYEGVADGDQDATDEWLRIATHMVDIFRETKPLFPSDGNKKFTGVLRRGWRRKGAKVDIESEAKEMTDRLERTMNVEEEEEEEKEEEDAATTFRGITFERWLELILKYAVLLTLNDDIERAIETLQHVTHANVFRQDRDKLLAIKLGQASCFAFKRNYAEVIKVARWVHLRYQFQTDSIRLLFALVPGGSNAIDAFNSSPLQKFIMRQLRILDAIANGASVKLSTLDSIVLDGDKAADRDEDGEDATGNHAQLEDRFLPTKHNPVYDLAYGQMLMVSRSFGSAIIYLLRAYERAPKQPLVNLSLGVAYLMRAMSRQTDNRHHQIAQGFAFLSQYRAAKGTCQEVEYNFGRAFHHLGLQAYAVKHYEACLDLAAVDRLAWRQSRMNIDQQPVDDADDFLDEPGDYARVAAYNLANLYTFSGQPELAKVVAAKWLAV